MPEKKIIYIHESIIEKEYIVICGAGKFGEETLTLDKVRAVFLLIELYKFLNLK